MNGVVEREAGSVDFADLDVDERANRLAAAFPPAEDGWGGDRGGSPALPGCRIPCEEPRKAIDGGSSPPAADSNTAP